MKKTLDAWLAWQAQLHPSMIDLGLARCAIVAERMHLLTTGCPIITVAGTNGKGSSVNLLDAIYRAAGYQVGRFTSPHLLKYNERIVINGAMVDDAALCAAFTAIDAAREDTSLTFFEFGTLAALYLFKQADLDLWVLEVGLGGRLDSVNIADADVALITTIGIDHVAYLGSDRNSIGHEKAGIMRSAAIAVCSDPDAPKSIGHYANKVGASLTALEADFQYEATAQAWSWSNAAVTYTQLPLPDPAEIWQLNNASGVLQVINAFQSRLNVSEKAMRQGLSQSALKGRFQRLNTPFPAWLDVTHNPLAAKALRQALISASEQGTTHALVGMLADKDIKQVFSLLIDVVDVWHVVDLEYESRAARATDLARILADLGKQSVSIYASPTQAFQHLKQSLKEESRLIVFGCFATVKAILADESLSLSAV